MGLKPGEVKALTLLEFNLMLTGYHKRRENEWNIARHLMAYTATYAGMGATKFVQPKDVMSLDLDREGEKKMITTLAQAMQMLKEFKKLV